MKSSTIQICGLSIGYKTKKNKVIVAEGLTSQIRRGELTCLVGANGVGKSTLLKTLSGFQPPLSGEILINNKKLETYSQEELSKLISVVLTEKVEVQDMSVTELISLGRSPYTGFWGKLTKKDKEVVAKSIEQINISGLAHRFIQELSDGERQKVMIAKALAQETPIIFLDEPTAFLDFPSKVEIIQLLHTLCKKMEKTIFLSTHDIDLAIQISDKLWMLDKKKGLIIGSPEELAENGSIEQFFSSKNLIFDRSNYLFRLKKQIL